MKGSRWTRAAIELGLGLGACATTTPTENALVRAGF
jgi:hypothetical protein